MLVIAWLKVQAGFDNTAHLPEYRPKVYCPKCSFLMKPGKWHIWKYDHRTGEPINIRCPYRCPNQKCDRVAVMYRTHLWGPLWVGREGDLEFMSKVDFRLFDE